MIQPGSRIDHYVIIEKIGQGGQAIVWSAHDERLKRTVAIKTVNLYPDADSSTSPGSSLTTPERFREEAEIIAGLEHPNILPVYGFGQNEDLLYIVMRYMPSGSLRDQLHRSPLTPVQAVHYLEPLAGALDLAHEHRILHRDLKSANILLDAQQHPYLADFGLSTAIGSKISESSGTLNYMSPEQMLGDPLDHRSDLYAFGIMIYELLTGNTPRVAAQPWTVYQLANGAIALPLHDLIAPPIADVLNRATAFDRERRYSSAAELVAALKAVVQPDSTSPARQQAPLDPARQAFSEARALFERALERWSDGAGRFRLEAGDFKYITSFFDDFDVWDITLDGPTLRLLLRAALEHGHELDRWWKQVPNDADRRAVALQTLTSDYPAARIRALERLADLPDSDPPAIPIRAASILTTEPDPDVLLAGIALLEKRAPAAAVWRPIVYLEPVDGTMAFLATHNDPRVAEAASRACARVRSSYAIRRLVLGAGAGDAASWQALITIRDEAGSLPPEVPFAIRARVFAALSIRQLRDQPLELVGRYLCAVLGYGLGLGIVVYFLFNSGNGLLALQQVGNAMAVGALYGALTGLGITAAVEIPARLRAWSRAGRIALGWAAGTVLCAMAFGAFHSYFYFDPVPLAGWPSFLVATLVFCAGFAITSGLTRNPALRAL
ncbi:MAG TPA: serine/threonine-protein kinase, partial [Aggregatilineales bacterium]|nr:serine/threonine-protein kinase [Aggregatilineales bacterium]